MTCIGRGIVMERPDHDVCVQTGEADEEGSRALVLKTRGVDSHFVERQVVGLAGHIFGGERTTDHRGVRGKKPHAIDRFEVAFSFDTVSDLNRHEASRVGDYQIGSSVGGWAKQITRARGAALSADRFSGVGVAVQIESIDEGTRECARETTGDAGRKSICIVVRVKRETRVRTTVN